MEIGTLKWFDHNQDWIFVNPNEEQGFESNHVTRGTGDNQRIGNQITCHSLYLKCIVQQKVSTIYPGNLATNSENLIYKAGYVRVLVIVDHQPKHDTWQLTDVLTSYSMLSFVNMANRARFTILMDKLFQLDEFFTFVNYGNATQNSNHYYKKFIPLHGLKTTFGPIEISTNQIMVMAYTDIIKHPTTNTNNIEFKLSTRLRYTDG